MDPPELNDELMNFVLVNQKKCRARSHGARTRYWEHGSEGVRGYCASKSWTPLHPSKSPPEPSDEFMNFIMLTFKQCLSRDDTLWVSGEKRGRRGYCVSKSWSPYKRVIPHQSGKMPRVRARTPGSPRVPPPRHVVFRRSSSHSFG
jgi:hypothetical protein